MFVWIVVLGIIIYSFIQPCLRRNASDANHTLPRILAIGEAGQEGSRALTPLAHPHHIPKMPVQVTARSGSQGSGLVLLLGALGNHLLNRPSESLEYDRERERRLPGSISRRRLVPGCDRGEGSSDLDAMRTNTGYGGSSSR
ncbi:hypothetical protein DFJ58DRAFT_747828 [Suillus subalutaceus]|uniref:uncharacterized protein n=1 Tax=Suillus subalutaceus TaxID=48586 RepID=UPI001B85F50A|nr:uncharacterized protein DFJ58DRAFT_747828 [Suillus subalutaceus]KAG1843562.1 hypothetical protein DFJ58DRAFT_747828 [Suillus subalutaceus]